jgi:hypothetical protein
VRQVHPQYLGSNVQRNACSLEKCLLRANLLKQSGFQGGPFAVPNCDEQTITQTFYLKGECLLIHSYTKKEINPLFRKDW